MGYGISGCIHFLEDGYSMGPVAEKTNQEMSVKDIGLDRDKI